MAECFSIAYEFPPHRKRFRVLPCLPCSPASVSQALRRRAEARVDTQRRAHSGRRACHASISPAWLQRTPSRSPRIRPPLCSTKFRANSLGWQPRRLVNPTGCPSIVRLALLRHRHGWPYVRLRSSVQGRPEPTRLTYQLASTKTSISHHGHLDWTLRARDTEHSLTTTYLPTTIPRGPNG